MNAQELPTRLLTSAAVLSVSLSEVYGELLEEHGLSRQDVEGELIVELLERWTGRGRKCNFDASKSSAESWGRQVLKRAAQHLLRRLGAEGATIRASMLRPRDDLHARECTVVDVAQLSTERKVLK